MSRFEPKNERGALVLSPLDALDEPQSLVDLRREVGERLPRVDLPEVLLEVDTWTGFTKAFSHVSEARARVDDLATSVCAVLIAEACNLGHEPLLRSSVPALTRGRLSWVSQNYVRGATNTNLAPIIHLHEISDSKSTLRSLHNDPFVKLVRRTCRRPCAANNDGIVRCLHA